MRIGTKNEIISESWERRMSFLGKDAIPKIKVVILDLHVAARVCALPKDTTHHMRDGIDERS